MKENYNEIYKIAKNQLLGLRNDNNLADPINTFVNTLNGINKGTLNEEFSEIYTRVTALIQVVINQKKPGGRLTGEKVDFSVGKLVEAEYKRICRYINFAAFGKDVKKVILEAFGNLLMMVGLTTWGKGLLDKKEEALMEAEGLTMISKNFLGTFFCNTFTMQPLKLPNKASDFSFNKPEIEM